MQHIRSVVCNYQFSWPERSRNNFRAKGKQLCVFGFFPPNRRMIKCIEFRDFYCFVQFSLCACCLHENLNIEIVSNIEIGVSNYEYCVCSIGKIVYDGVVLI